MSRVDEIQERLRQLPLEKQSEVLDFVSFLQQQLKASQRCPRQGSLREHPAFGSWRGRGVDALSYQRTIRAEWDNRA